MNFRVFRVYDNDWSVLYDGDYVYALLGPPQPSNLAVPAGCSDYWSEHCPRNEIAAHTLRQNRLAYIDNCLRSHKRPPSPLLKWSQIWNFLTSGSTIMFKWPGKNYNITYKLSLDFRIIKTMLRVLGDFSKTGQLWNRFDDSNTKSSHQGNILKISGHLDVI